MLRNGMYWLLEQRIQGGIKMSCLGCYHFHPRGGNIGYCDLMDYVVTVNNECDDWEEDINEDWENLH